MNHAHDAAGPTRRAVLVAATGAAFAGCDGRDAASYVGGWVGAAVDRGHLLRTTKSGALPTPAVQRRVGVLVVGAGIAGLGAARALAAASIDDVHLLDLEDVAGGNSRGHRLGGMACPLGAHYLPLPGERATEVIALLEDFGLRRTDHGRAVYDERHLCHSPQERLSIDGAWHEGLLPPIDALPRAERAATLADYRRFAALVEAVGQGGAFCIPTARAAWTPALAALDAVPFSAWLDAQGLRAPALRWYLDYCCRDDYGAGAAQVSAWAGLHYFASRHGFQAPGAAGVTSNDTTEPSDGTLSGVLTWPEGNAWLAQRLALPLRERTHLGRVALRVREERHQTSVDVWNVALRQVERWTAAHTVLALPLFIAARIVESPPAALTTAAALVPHTPWLVGNLWLDGPLNPQPGAAPAWDNVAYTAGPQGATLGYVDAQHQSMRPYADATVLTTYWALGGDTAAQLQAGRRRLLEAPWSTWADAVAQDVRRLHPDLPGRLRQVDLMRYGHAMALPGVGVRGHPALRALAAPSGRLHCAHSDLSAYSVFEEALYHGARAAADIVCAFRNERPTPGAA